jgi:purine-binding chemotaxis protein CheW
MEPAVSPAEKAAQRFLTFRVEGRLYALPAEQVSEVIRLPPIARVPQAPKGLLGVANLRGIILPIASVRGLLGRPEGVDAAPWALVLDGAAPVAAAVDAIETLATIAAEKIETRQTELSAKPGERIVGAFAVRDGAAVAKILDIQALIGAAFVQNVKPRERRALTSGGNNIERTQQMDERQKLVTFDVAGQEYAFDLAAVQEIIDAPQTATALPASEDAVVGVVSFRNSLLPLLSLRGLLDLARTEGSSGREKVIVARIGQDLVGLLADRMRTIFAADAELMEDIPPVLAARVGGEARISAIYRAEGGRRLISLLSPQTLFREDVMRRLGVATATKPSTAEAAGTSRGEERQFVVFRLGNDEFGLPIEAVNEVARVPDQIARVPKAPKFLEGVINLRGEVLPVVDQRRRFGMPVRADDKTRRLLVVRTARHRAGLIVDSVSEVLRCDAAEIEPAPNLTNETVRLVHGVVNLEQAGRIVLLLDPAELLTRTERGLLDAFEAKTENAR